MSEFDPSEDELFPANEKEKNLSILELSTGVCSPVVGVLGAGEKSASNLGKASFRDVNTPVKVLAI